MKSVKVPERYNYIAVFLTFACNLSCSYCINDYGGISINRKREMLTGQEWAKALDRLEHGDVPITLGGGEPTFHPDFYYLVNELHDRGHKMDLLTNGMFHIDNFMRQVKPIVFKRDAPYASIRISYHPETMSDVDIFHRTKILQDAGYYVGIWGVNHPLYKNEMDRMASRCYNENIDFRLKEFLGEHDGKLHGTYEYPAALSSAYCQDVMCRTSELIVGPDGSIYRCHADLYGEMMPIYSINSADLELQDVYRVCNHFGHCNPCDIKTKFNRFQISGHCAVEIKTRNERSER